ncbi:transcription antitermination factor NusB [Candidatus Curtissbacteria bacterium]|nr:transcription antitermination factor NusB [Candidatus Curtissbacteria bacterium]
MKKKSDPRHTARVKTVKKLFEATFRSVAGFPKGTTEAEVLNHKKKIDNQISKNAPAWPIEQIAPINLSILRLAIWELLYKKKQEPYKVILDEAIEIAKEYSGEASAGFINGVLGTIIKTRLKNKL